MTASRSSLRRRSFHALAGSLLVLLGSLTFAHDADGDANLLRLAERLVGPWGAPGEGRVEILPSTLPAAMEVALPLPDGFDLVGSLARYDRDVMVSLQVVLDGHEGTTSAFESLRRAFEEGGWSFLSDGGMVGFVPTSPSLFGRACAPEGEDGAQHVAFVSASPHAEGASDVRIDLNRDAWEGACAHYPEHALEGFAPLPTLAAPDGGNVSGQLMSHGPEDAMTLAVLRGGGDVDAVVAHYAEELRAAGWTMTPGSVRHDLGVRSRWAFVTAAGVPWAGVLAVEWPVRTGPVMLSFTVVAELGP